MNLTLVRVDTRGQDLSQPQGKPACPGKAGPTKVCWCVSWTAPRKAGLGRSPGPDGQQSVSSLASPKEDTDVWQRHRNPSDVSSSWMLMTFLENSQPLSHPSSKASSRRRLRQVAKASKGQACSCSGPLGAAPSRQGYRGQQPRGMGSWFPAEPTREAKKKGGGTKERNTPTAPTTSPPVDHILCVHMCEPHVQLSLASAPSFTLLVSVSESCSLPGPCLYWGWGSEKGAALVAGGVWRCHPQKLAHEVSYCSSWLWGTPS